MNVLTINNFDDEAVKKIERDASLHGLSIREEIRMMLQQTVPNDREQILREMAEIRNAIPYQDIDSTDLIREDRDRHD